MHSRVKKRGQKISRRFSRFSRKKTDQTVEHIQENIIERVSHIRHIRLLILEWSLLVLAIIMLSVTQAFWYVDSYRVEGWGRGGTYTEATIGKVASLNPIFASTSSEKVLSKLMFATLAAPDYSGHIGPALASSITVDDTGTKWTVKLREGLKWSDGEPITNTDVLYTVKVLQSDDISTSYSSNLAGVKVTEEDGALTFTLPAAYANFSSALNFPILPSHILADVPAAQLVDNIFSTTPITSGAFSFNASQNVGTSGEKIIYLNKNPSFYGGEPYLDSFVVHTFLGVDDILEALNNGSVTATAELLPTDADLVNSSIIERQTALSAGVYAFFNTKQGVLSNKAIRKALQKGIDLESLRAPLGDEPVLNYPLLESQIEIKKYPELPEYDPTYAKDAIAKANIDKPIRIATTETGYFPALAENLKYQLEQLGLKVELSVQNPGQEFLLNVIRPRNYDILIYEIELGADPDLFAYYHSSQAQESGLNLSNYSNGLASDLILAARTAIDPSLRSAKYTSFLEHWVEDAPAIGIYQVNLSYFVGKNIRTFSEDNRLITAVDRFVDVNYWATEKTPKNRTP
ncbi:MAG: ABC transporter substrate-binding protein [Candidatus Saccharibacteria bacterium]|nr:ABC transporter substrate-binding protein [Candidatus Saccharibacteria bacterium]